jgi:peroxiredoxin (alkyl hydroperoxide reductase subunit C)
LGSPAPQFKANSTQGEIKLEDYQGKWVILFSHPADFTPVCTTELTEFAKLYPKFKELNCELIGLSIDSVFSHIAWIRNMEEKFSVKIPYPIIADLGGDVAHKYGMIMPGESDTATSRCVFFIDDKQNVRAMIYYPMTTGRNMDEILRVLQALQMNAKNGVACPANWRPGEKVIVPPPKTTKDAEERLKDKSVEPTDWYFVKKDVK